MMIGLNVTGVLEGVSATAAGFDAMAARAENLNAPMTRIMQVCQREAQGRLRSGSEGIKSRSNQLASSLTYAFASRNEAELGTNKAYGASQQFGPQGGFYESSRPEGFLAIPIGDNVGARGQAKISSPRLVPDGFFIRSKNGNLLFVRRKELPPRKNAGAKAKVKWIDDMPVASIPVRTKLELLFVLKERVPGDAHNYVQFTAENYFLWSTLSAQWILTGRV